MILKDLLLNLNMVMFGGKGGVGKTTCAASSAIWAAEAGRNTLIISTDPAHSLGDSLGLELASGIPTKIPDIKNLTALEIKPEADIEEFHNLSNINQMQGFEIPGIFDSMPMLDDLKDLTSINAPGIDEALALLKVLEFIETEHNYDLIIFDTAPTGHTLRFLSLPDTLSGWIGKILKMRFKFGKIFGSLKRLFTSDEESDDKSLEVLEHLKEAVLRARDDLMDPTKNSFVIVMIAEEMAITETNRLLNELIKYKIPVSNIVVNQLYKDNHELCDFCKNRKSMQQRNLKKIRTIFKDNMGKNIIEVPLFKLEVREYNQLKKFGRDLIDKSDS